MNLPPHHVVRGLSRFIITSNFLLPAGCWHSFQSLLPWKHPTPSSSSVQP